MDLREAKLEIAVLNPAHTTLSMRFLHSNELTEQFIVSSTSDLLLVFANLAALYMKPSFSLSQQSLLGLIISSEESHTCMCGTVLPVSVLSRWCRGVFTMESLKHFLLVCSCYHPLHVLRQSSQDSTILPCAGQVQLPPASLWDVLLWGEALGANGVVGGCKQKLCDMYVQHTHIPRQVLGLEGAEADEVEERVLAHLLKYPPLSPATPPQAKKLPPSSSPSPPSTAQPTYTQPTPPASLTPALYAHPLLAQTPPTPAAAYSLPPQLPQPAATPALHPTQSLEEASARGWSTDSEDDEEEEETQQQRPSAREPQQQQHLASPRYSPLVPRDLRSADTTSSSTSSPYVQHPADAGDFLHAPSPSSEPLRPASSQRGDRMEQRDRGREKWSISPAHHTSAYAHAHNSAASASRSASRSRRPASPPPPPARRSLSLEELKVSRSLASLRVQEAQLRNSVSQQRQLAERAAVRNNLAKLQLQAEVARLRSASRERGAGAERSSSRGRAPQLAEQRSLAYLEAQAAEQARLSAAKRIAEARRQEKEKQEAAREDTLRRREQKRQELLRRMEEKSRARSASPSLTPSTSATSTGGAIGTLTPVSTPSSSSRAQQRGRAASPSLSSSNPHGPRGLARAPTKDLAPSSPDAHTLVHSTHDELDAPPLYTQEALMAVGLGCSPRSPQPQPSSAATASSALRVTRPPPSPSYEVTLHRVWGLEEELGGVWAYATLSLPPSTPHSPPATSRTAPVPSSSPVFNHTCVLRGDGRLLLCVFNQHLSLSDELLGYVVIDLDKEGIVVGEGWGGVYHLLAPSSSPKAPATGGSAEVSLRRIE